MSKAVMISIQPKWCELIANGKKTVEVRKTKPKFETPFKVYIYCTKSRIPYESFAVSGGKVIGEFVCDRIELITEHELFYGMDEISDSQIAELSCVESEQLLRYKGKNDFLYAWDISNLVIYDKPKELSEFMHYKYFDWWDYGHHENKRQRELCNLTRPPQSWCYVEEQK